MKKEESFLNGDSIKERIKLVDFFRNEMSIQAQALAEDIDSAIYNSISIYGVMFKEYYVDLDLIKSLVKKFDIKKDFTLFRNLEEDIEKYYLLKNIKAECFFSTNKIIFSLI